MVSRAEATVVDGKPVAQAFDFGPNLRDTGQVSLLEAGDIHERYGFERMENHPNNLCLRIFLSQPHLPTVPPVVPKPSTTQLRPSQ